jgi:hypothetical protein
MPLAENPRRVFRVRRPDAQARLRLLALSLTLHCAPLLIIDNLPDSPEPDTGGELGTELVSSVRDTTTTETALPAQPLPAADLPTTDASAVTEPPVATTPTTEAPVATTVAPTTTTAPAPTTTTVAPWPVIDTGDVWYQLAQCESGGNWAHQGTYHGGLQFHPSTWVAYGGQEFASYAYQASAQQQITVGKRIVASQGGTFKAWPGCRRKLGLP